MRVLLTGFGPFGGVVNNPSSRLAEQLADTGFPGVELTTRVFPVSYSAVARELGELLDRERRDLILMLGVAERSPQVRLEKRARNLVGATPGHDGLHHSSERIVEDGPEELWTAVPVDRLLHRLHEERLPAEVSADAGSYLCNFAYYLALHRLSKSQTGTRCLFVHVPPDSETLGSPGAAAPQDLATTASIVRVILGELLEV
jgi:pyroglutamyl-peptidase